ncbi:MAG: hypothetical protein AAF492_29030, partial [Verrucomicrobiota bacterium]
MKAGAFFLSKRVEHPVDSGGMAQTNEFRNAKRRLKRHLDRIAEVDEEVAEALVTLGYPEPRLRERGFVTFLNIIISQQISTSAARAIRGRVFDLMPEVSARAFLKVEATRFREAGLSARKVEYATGLAEATIEGRFTPDRLSDLDDEEAIEHIVSLRGFGRWSAEIYLMFSLGRRDVFPADDLALL